MEHVAVGRGKLSLGVNYRTLCDPRLSQEQAMLFIEKFTDFVRGSGVDEKHHVVEEETTDSCKDKEDMDQVEKKLSIGSEKETMD